MDIIDTNRGAQGPYMLMATSTGFISAVMIGIEVTSSLSFLITCLFFVELCICFLAHVLGLNMFCFDRVAEWGRVGSYVALGMNMCLGDRTDVVWFEGSSMESCKVTVYIICKDVFVYIYYIILIEYE